MRGAGAGLKEHAAEIQDEFRRVAIEDAATLDSVGNNVWATAANSTSAQSYGPDWKTLALMDRCVWDETNTKLFPVATRLLRELGVPCIEAFYARMTPGSKIKPHSVCPAPRAPRPAPRAPRPAPGARRAASLNGGTRRRRTTAILRSRRTLASTCPRGSAPSGSRAAPPPRAQACVPRHREVIERSCGGHDTRRV